MGQSIIAFFSSPTAEASWQKSSPKEQKRKNLIRWWGQQDHNSSSFFFFLLGNYISSSSWGRPLTIDKWPRTNFLSPPLSNFFGFTSALTLIHMQSENGSVAMMRRMETRAKSRAQHPGPSGSAAIKKDKRKSLFCRKKENGKLMFASICCSNRYI